MDVAIEAARRQIESAVHHHDKRPYVRAFHDATTNAFSYVVHDPVTRKGAVIDAVMGFDPASGRISCTMADRMAAYASAVGIDTQYLIETHAHADHLSAAAYLQDKLGGKLAIGRDIVRVQRHFRRYFRQDELELPFEFDHLFEDGERFSLGEVEGTILHLPGHTPADVAVVIGNAAFVGDTIFMPDVGTARTDFPGGDAVQLHKSVRRLFSLPDETRIFLCHDYPPPGRDEYVCQTTIGAQRAANIHVRDGISEEEFVSMRTNRDRTLALPALFIPSLQVNLNGGRLPEPAANGLRYIRIPIDAF
jgi:glyoxylase-like metal-dependent hydrolase (beta-lactamase superfamily II)